MENTHLLLCLADSNLPTGGFVASAGLESHATHGFLHQTRLKHGGSVNDALLGFTEHNLNSYAKLALPFVNDAYQTIHDSGVSADGRLERLCALDALMQSMLSNAVARRASKAQGAALLSLYVRSLKPPGSLSAQSDVIERLRRLSLSSKSSFESHLPVCWGIVAAAIGLSMEQTRHLHLFLQARSILSAAVRLNVVGPYAAHAELIHRTEPILARLLADTDHLTTARTRPMTAPMERWADEDDDCQPCTTWPLQEILAARHDAIHSRLFNS